MAVASALPRCAPEAEGIQSAAIHAFVDAVERDVRYLHSVMILRRGHVVAEGWWEPYGPTYRHVLFSLSKSFTSTAVGLLAAEGRLSIDDPVLSFFPDEAPAEADALLRALRVRHLLTMTTGHAGDPTNVVFQQTSRDWVSAFLAEPLTHEPGTHFVYNTAATYMLSAIVQRVTGLRLVHYLQPRLFQPLGIEDPIWEMSPQGIDIGGAGLNTTTDAIARFGQLYLQKGVWQGARLLQEEWVEQATASQVPNGPALVSDWEQGYGYQFWRCRHGAYRGDGAFGQFCLVLPAQEAVVAITAGVDNLELQLVLDLVWEHLLPALGPAPLQEDRAAQAALAARLASLCLPAPRGERMSPVAARVSGRTYMVDPNDDGIDAVAFDFADDGCMLTVRNDRGEHRIPCGYGTWVRGEAAIEQAAHLRIRNVGTRQVAASGAWTDEQTYVAQIWWYETPFGRTLTCRFDGDRLQIEQQVNVAFGPTDRPLLAGRLA
jgi:CubicO group peptidase (beta-lactamase class C family)